MRCLLQPAEIKNEQFYTMKHTCTNAWEHTHNSHKKFFSQFITAIGLDNSDISPTLLRALTDQSTCTPSPDLWHFLHIPITYHPHTLLPQKYWKDVLPKHWCPATRLLELFCAPYLQQPILGNFYTCFQSTFFIKYQSNFQEPAKCTAGTTNSAFTGTLVIWYKFLDAHKKLELYITSHQLLMIINMVIFTWWTESHLGQAPLSKTAQMIILLQIWVQIMVTF